MAQSQQPPRDGEAEFVRAIVTDPRNVPDVMRLYGYLGASSEENHDRLYLNPDLSTYVEVPRAAVLHRMAVPTEQDPNGAVVLWVRQDAALIYKMAPAAQALANYFAGAIAGAAAAGPVPDPWAPQYLAGVAGAGAAAMPPAPPFFTGPHCPPITPFCPSVVQVHCPQPHRTPFCPSAVQVHCPQPTYPVSPCWSLACGPGFGQAAGAAQAAAPFLATPFCPSVVQVHCPQPHRTPFCLSVVQVHCPQPTYPFSLCYPCAGFGQAAGAAQAAAPFLATPGFGCPWTVPPNCPPHTFLAGCTQVPVICHCIGQTVPK
jgi:hypothetical protein